MKDGQYDNIRCACHGLHLVVKRGEAASDEFSNLLSKVSRKVETFRRSHIALQNFKERQHRFSLLPEHKLIQQVSTRWNSTFLMIERFTEQKQAIGDYANRHSEFENLTKLEWDMLEEGRNLMKHFVTASVKFSCRSDCSVSEVIPTVKWLIHKLETRPTCVSALNELILWLNKQDPQYFGDIEHKPAYAFATFLDPR